MAATAVASSISTTSMQNLSCVRPKLASSRMLRMEPCATSHSLRIHYSSVIGCLPDKWRRSRVVAAVAEEAAVVEEVVAEQEEVVTEEEEAVVEEEETVAVTGEEETVAVAGEEETVAVAVEAESAEVNTKLYFGNLPYNVDSAQLAGIVQDIASPELIEVLYDRFTGKSRGFAFVTMSTVEDCKLVIENLDGREFGGRTLRVNLSDKPKAKEPLYPETEHKLFVGNLSWTVTSDHLTEAFQEYGRVVGARVLYDGETGRSRGYGFVCYETRDEMEAALNFLNGVELEGRSMRVSLAEGKKNR